jgi:methylphosphotriester-DNA--protein-cysteine methyltransferase
MAKVYRLVGVDGRLYESAIPGTLGGHRADKIYGRLDCRGALRWIAKGHYVKQRVFFADEATAIAAGYRPCANCLRERYALWKRASTEARDRQDALERYRALLADLPEP